MDGSALSSVRARPEASHFEISTFQLISICLEVDRAAADY